MQAALPASEPDSLHPAFANVIYLLACHFGPEHLAQFEPIFLKRVKSALRASLTNADRLFDYVRAYGLQALYYYYKGR